MYYYHTMTTEEKFEELFKEFRTKVKVAEQLGIHRPRLDEMIEEAGFDYKEWKENNRTTSQRSTVPRKPIVKKVDQLSKDWIEEAENHPYTVYTLQANGSKYVGFTGDLSARFFQHRYGDRFRGEEVKILECEFFYLKFQAKDRERELIAWYYENKIHTWNIKLTANFQIVDGIDQGERYRPHPPKSGYIYYTSGNILPTFTEIIETIRRDTERDPLNKTLTHLLTRANGRSRALFVMFYYYIERLTKYE